MKIALFLLFVAACVVGQAQNPGDIELLIIDEFVLGQNVQSVEVTATTAIVSGQDPPLSTTDSFNAGSGCSGLLGCVRDLSIEVTQSLQGRSYTADVLPGQIAVATAKGGQSNIVVQYDSVPGITNPPASAMSFDLTGGNSSPYFFFSILSVTGIEGAYQLEDTYYYVDFQAASFSSCDMTQISSVQLRMSYFDAVDIIINKFSVYGPVPATPTATQTPAPPTPTISGSALSNTTSLSTSASLSITPSLSVTPSLSTTASLSVTPSLSTTPTRSIAPSPSGSASRSSTATPSVSPIRIQTASRTPAASSSSSITPTASASKSTGATPSRTPSASPLCGSCPRGSQVVESVEEPVAVTVGTIEVVAPPGSLRVGETLIVVNAGNSQSQNVPLPPGEISGDVVIIDLIDENGNEVQPSGPIEICITPGSNPPDDLCLAFQSNGAWLCADDSPVLTNGQYCGVTNHFTIFALVSKRSIPEPIGPAPGDRSSFSFGDSSTTYAFPTSFFNTFQTNAFTSAFSSSPSDSSDGVSMISFLSVGVVALFLVALC